MSHRIPSFKALAAFEATARLKSVSIAAKELFVTPGAVSRQITLLEDLVNQPLMRRSPQGIVLTERGEKLAISLGSAFEDISKAIRAAERQDEHSIVTINVYPTFAISWLMPRLAEFHATCPDIDLRIKTSLQPPNFKGDDIDVAVIISDVIPPGLSGVPLFERVFSPVCSPELLERNPGIKLKNMLQKERLLVSDMHISLWNRWLDLFGIPNDIINRGIRFENSSLAWQAARKGAGFAMGQEALLESDINDGRLVSPFSETILDERIYRLVCRESEQNIPSIKAVFSWFQKEMNFRKGLRDSAPESKPGE
jgi:LysR family glycine cleavage system transcriptional activator